MSTLSDKIDQLTAPRKPLSFITWFASLSKDDQEATWNALTNEDLKSYTIYGIFREEGLRMSKDTFISLRRNILAGNVKRTDIDE